MIFTTIVIVALLVILFTNGMTRLVFRQITQMRQQTNESMYEYLERLGVFSKDRFEELDKRKVQITSRDGLQLSGYVLEMFPESKRWMIIVHGYTVSLHISTQYIDMFKAEGFNVLLIDQRRHGESQGDYTTYGFQEKYDVDSWVHWILGQYGEDVIIGLHGQSLGGGTVLEYLAIAHPNVKFVIADCPYSDLTELLQYQMSVLHKIPVFPLLSLVNRRIKRKAGFQIKQVSPIKTVENSRIPVLFVHGTEDKYVPTYMSRELYKHKPEPKSLLLVDGAVHANAYGVDPKRYEDKVHALIKDALGTAEMAPSYFPSI